MNSKYFSLSPRILSIAYIIIAIFVILYGYFSSNSYSNERKQLIFRELSIQADLKAKRIKEWRNERFGDAGVMTNNINLSNDYNEWLKNPDNEMLKNDVLNDLLMYERYFNYKNIILLDKSRQVRLSLNEVALPLDSVTLSNVNLSISNKYPTISDLYISKSDSSIYMDVASPFYSGDELIGVVILRIDPNHYLYPEVNNWPVNSSTTESILLRVEGDKVVYLNNLRFKNNTALKHKIDIKSENEHITSVKAAKGHRGFVEGFDYKNSRTLNVIKQIDKSPWILINKIDLDELHAPIKSYVINQILFLGFILLIIGAGLIWLWQNRKKTLQIQKLEDEKRSAGIAKNYEKVIKFANIAMIITDTNHVINDVNERALSLYGYTLDEIIGMNISDFLDTDAENIIDNLKDEDDRLKDGIVYESIQKRKDNSTFCAEINISIIEIDGKKYYHRIINDITQRKLASEKLKESNEYLEVLNSEKDKLFSIIAHDLREPLGSFMNITKLMDENKSTLSVKEFNEFVRLMKESSANLYVLLENLLEWSTMKRGLLKLDLKLLSLHESIGKNLQMLKESARRKNLELTISVPEDITVYADERMLNGIVRNIGTNAIKFTLRGGKIFIEAKYEDSEIVSISISDTGIGMTQEMIDTIFDSKLSTKRVGTEGEPSSGLGLILCKEFADKIGGKIFVYSEKEKGSTFVLLLRSKVSGDLKQEAAVSDTEQSL